MMMIDIDDLKKWRANRIVKGSCNYDDMQALGKFIDEVETIGWTDVGDELPDTSQTVLIAWYPLKGRCPYPHYYALGSWLEYEHRWDTDIAVPHEVLAWIHLPKPYEEDD